MRAVLSVGLAVGGLSGLGVAATSAAAPATPPRGFLSSAAPALAPGAGAVPAVASTVSASFTDVPAGAQFSTEIQWLADQEISTGWAQPDGTRIYQPLQPVARDAMAAFMYRLAGSPAFTPPAVSPFADITPSTQFYKEITWLAAQGISTGWSQPDGTKAYRPLDSVARDAMAAFMYRLAGSPASTAPAASPFADITPSTQFYKEITWLAANGISTGWTQPDGTKAYQPLSSVARDAMAAFMYRYYRLTHPLAVTAGTFHDGMAGARYLEQLTATGGIAPLTWTATGLPAGLTVTPDGAVSGIPTGTGTTTASFTVTDAAGSTATVTRTISVPTSMPAGCIGQACADLTPSSRTVQVPAASIGAVTRDPSTGKVTAVTLAGPSVNGIALAAGQVLVLAPATGLDSGAIAYVDALAPNPDGTVTASVTPTTPADAYPQATVNAIDPTMPTNGTTAAPAALLSAGTAGTARTALYQKKAAAPMAVRASEITTMCDRPDVQITLAGASLTADMTPSMAAVWNHPVAQVGNIYIGPGGLSLFQFDLDGGISLNLSASITGQANCTLSLPEFRAVVPAGELGAVVFAGTPTFTLSASGKAEISGSVALKCGAEYRWYNGSQDTTRYCKAETTPFGLSSDNGAKVVGTGAIDARVALDDTVGITGQLNATAEADYTPNMHPVFAVDASTGWELGACLACFWSDSPAHVTIATGTFFSKELLRLDTPPPAPTAPGAAGPLAITASALPDGTVGNAYRAYLTATGGTAPYTWAVASGTLPPGLHLEPTTGAITGTPTAVGSSSSTLAVTDDAGAVYSAPVTLVVSSGAIPGLSAIAAASAQVDALTSNGTLWTWGSNETGELGQGLPETYTTFSSRPAQVQGISGVTSVVAAGQVVYVLLSSGEVSAWGANGWGNLGNGTTTDSDAPVSVAGLTGITDVASAGNSAYAVRNDGTVWSWGYNGDGELGNGTDGSQYRFSSVPVQVTGLSGIVKVWPNGNSAYALRNDGTVWSWGYNADGQLGNGSTTSSSVPVQVAGITDVQTLTTSADHGTAYALKSDGTVWAWGRGDDGQLGNGGTSSSSVPVQVQTLAGVREVTAGYRSAFAVQGDGTLWSWGANDQGQLGIGPEPAASMPVKVPLAASVASVIASPGNSVYALGTDGSVRSWGWNGDGQLGTGDTLDQYVPGVMPDLQGITSLSTGAGTLYAVSANGQIWACGANSSGQLGNGTVADAYRPTPVTP